MTSHAAVVARGMGTCCVAGCGEIKMNYDSKQFSTGEFFLWGIPASILLMIVTGFAVYVLWPIMGMPILTSGSLEKKDPRQKRGSFFIPVLPDTRGFSQDTAEKGPFSDGHYLPMPM